MSYRKNRVNASPEATISRGKPASEMLSAGRRWQLPAIRLGLAVIAVPLALYDLGKPSFGLDEGSSFAIAYQHGSAFATAVAHDGGNMLLYYTLLHTALTAGLPTSAAAIRSLSVLPFVCLGPVVFEIGRRLRSPLTGLIAALLVLLNTQIVSTAQSARSYAYVVLFVSLSFLALLLDRQHPSRRYRFLWLGAAILATYCHLLSALFVGAQLMWTLAEPTPIAARRRLLPYLGTYLASCVPLLWLAHRRGAQQISWIPPLNFAEFRDLASFLFKGGGYGDPRLLLGLLTILACLAGTVHALQGWPQRDQLAEWGRIGVVVWIAVPILLAIVISIVQPVLYSLYFVEAVPAIAILAADGIMSLGSGTLKFVPIVLSAALIGLLAYTLVPAYGQSAQNWKGATALILSSGSPHDGIVFLAPEGWNTVDYYLLSQHDHSSAPTPVFPGRPWALVKNYARDPQVPSRTALECAAKHYRVIWLVIANTSMPAQYAAIRELTNDFAVRRSYAFSEVGVERLSAPRTSRYTSAACL
jgi:mannosyltransferase